MSLRSDGVTATLQHRGVTLSPVAVETGNGVDDEWSASKARAELVDVATGERAISAIALYVYRISISPFRLISPFVSAAAKKYEKHIEEEKLIRVPSSLDVTPYRDEKDFELFFLGCCWIRS